jgi:hypothetical protein
MKRNLLLEHDFNRRQAFWKNVQDLDTAICFVRKVKLSICLISLKQATFSGLQFTEEVQQQNC